MRGRLGKMVQFVLDRRINIPIPGKYNAELEREDKSDSQGSIILVGGERENGLVFSGTHRVKRVQES